MQREALPTANPRTLHSSFPPRLQPQPFALPFVVVTPFPSTGTEASGTAMSASFDATTSSLGFLAHT